MAKANDPQERPTHSALLERAPDHLKMIGLVAANWAILEHRMCHLLCFITGMNWPAVRAILYTIASNRLRRDVIRNVAFSQGYDQESIAMLDKVLTKIGRVAKRRNDYMHYHYGIAKDGVVQHKPDPRSSTDESYTVTERQLENLAEEISMASEMITPLFGVFHKQYLERQGGP